MQKTNLVNPEIKTTKEAIKTDLLDCICVQLWMPVCGNDGKTYSNSCFANCAGVKYEPGSCSSPLKE